MKNTDFSKKIVILMFGTMILFTLFVFVTFWKFGAVPDSLIEPFFSFFKFEGGALGIIKVSKLFCKKKSSKEEKEDLNISQGEESEE